MCYYKCMSQKNNPTTIRASKVLAAIEEFSHGQKVMAEILNDHTSRLKRIEEDASSLQNDMVVVKQMTIKHDRVLKSHG